MACDQAGNRVGYGGGYFDRFLQGTKFHRIAICFDFQIAKEIESEVFDQKMNFVVSERRIINCESYQEVIVDEN